MATTTIEERLQEVRRRIERLQDSANEAGGKTKAAAQARLDALRTQEAALRESVAKAFAESKAGASATKQAVEDRLEELEAKVKATRHAIAADAADDAKSFSDAVSRELEEWDAYFDRVQERLAGRKEKAVAELKQLRAHIGGELDAVRAASAESWAAVRKRVDQEREQLAARADELAARLRG